MIFLFLFLFGFEGSICHFVHMRMRFPWCVVSKNCVSFLRLQLELYNKWTWVLEAFCRELA